MGKKKVSKRKSLSYLWYGPLSRYLRIELGYHYSGLNGKSVMEAFDGMEVNGERLVLSDLGQSRDEIMLAVMAKLWPAGVPEKYKSVKRDRKKLSRSCVDAVVKTTAGNIKTKIDPRTDAFLRTHEWRKARYLALKKSSGCCACCGARASKSSPLHVDHIKPRSKYPALALDPDNLQVLCAECNQGKGNWDETDWR